MAHLPWPLLMLAGAIAALVLHFGFWGWIYRIRGDSDALLEAICADGWKLAVAHFRPAKLDARPPVILCHGLSANRWNLSMPGRYSLAGFLKSRGREVFVVDLRGCGDSAHPPPGKHRNDWDFDDHVLLDAPAVLELALRTSGKKSAFWVGHSMGGLIGLALAEGDAAGPLAGVAALGSPTRWEFHRPDLRRMLKLSVWFAWSGRIHNKWLARIIAPYLGYLPLPLTDVAINPQNIDGPIHRQIAYQVIADSSRKLLLQFASWYARNTWELTRTGVDLRAGLARIRCPVLLIGGTLDFLAPPKAMEAALADLGASEKSLVLFGKARGDKQDYGHGDLVFGRHAPEEIFPELEAWMSAHGDQGASQLP